MAKSKLKKQIKKLKTQMKYLNEDVEDIHINISELNCVYDGQCQGLQTQIDELKAQKCECHTNTQKTNKISTAGQESGELEQSVATWFDESTELTEEELKALLERIKTGKLKPHKILFERSPRFIITTNAIDVF